MSYYIYSFSDRISFCLQVGLNTDEGSQKLNLNLISRLSKESDVLVHAHDAIFGILNETEEYVKTWTSYQALWDLQFDQVYNRIGNNLEVESHTISRLIVWACDSFHSYKINFAIS